MSASLLPRSLSRAGRAVSRGTVPRVFRSSSLFEPVDFRSFSTSNPAFKAAGYDASSSSGTKSCEAKNGKEVDHVEKVLESEDGNAAATSSDSEEKSSKSDERISGLETELEEQKEKASDLLSRLRLAHADAENARKRHETEISNAKSYAITKFAKDVVEVADNLSRAVETFAGKEDKLEEGSELKSLFDGVKLTEDVLMQTFAKYSISKVDPMGEKFDPKLHEAMFTLDSDKEKDAIVHVMQPGWTIKDRLLRAARVGTSKGPTA